MGRHLARCGRDGRRAHARGARRRREWTAGAPDAGDPFFGQVGMRNGGYDVQHYSLELDYDPATRCG